MRGRLGELMARIEWGDEEAFRLLYECLADQVFALSLSILRDRFAAEDVRQETFLKVYARVESLRDGDRSDSTIRSWVLTIARNLSIDHYQKHRREIPSAEPGMEERAFLLFDADRLCERLDMEALLAAIPAQCREIVLLRIFARLSHAQCSEILRVSIPTVKRRLRRGLTALRRRLESEQGFAGSGIEGERNVPALE